MKTLLRAAAIAVASTALVAGGAVTTGASAAPNSGDGSAVNISFQPFSTSGYKSSGTTYVPTAFSSGTAGVTISSLKATVNVNGVPVANDVSVFASTGFAYERAWGTGVVSLSNVLISGSDTRPGSSGSFFGKPAAAVSPNGAQVTYGIDYRSQIKVTKRGKKLTFKLKARFVDNRGVSVGIRKATIQVKKGSKWKTLKNVKLKRNGTATYKTSSKKKRNYRLLIKPTSLYQGGNTTGTRKI